MHFIAMKTLSVRSLSYHVVSVQCSTMDRRCPIEQQVFRIYSSRVWGSPECPLLSSPRELPVSLSALRKCWLPFIGAGDGHLCETGSPVQSRDVILLITPPLSSWGFLKCLRSFRHFLLNLFQSLSSSLASFNL